MNAPVRPRSTTSAPVSPEGSIAGRFALVYVPAGKTFSFKRQILAVVPSELRIRNTLLEMIARSFRVTGDQRRQHKGKRIKYMFHGVSQIIVLSV
jgi:hypothetical protein